MEQGPTHTQPCPRGVCALRITASDTAETVTHALFDTLILGDVQSDPEGTAPGSRMISLHSDQRVFFYPLVV